MIRSLSAAVFVWAALDLPAWRMDRPGVALLGLGLLALSVGRYAPGRPPLASTVPAAPAPYTVERDLEAAIADYCYADTLAGGAAR